MELGLLHPSIHSNPHQKDTWHINWSFRGLLWIHYGPVNSHTSSIMTHLVRSFTFWNMYLPVPWSMEQSQHPWRVPVPSGPSESRQPLAIAALCRRQRCRRCRPLWRRRGGVWRCAECGEPNARLEPFPWAKSHPIPHSGGWNPRFCYLVQCEAPKIAFRWCQKVLCHYGLWYL